MAALQTTVEHRYKMAENPTSKFSPVAAEMLLQWGPSVDAIENMLREIS